MNLVFRIVFWIIVAVIFLSITFSTFFLERQYASIADLEIQTSQKLSSSGWVYYNNISKFESLYSNFEFEQKLSLEQPNIALLTDGKYVSSLRNIGVSYDFTGTWYIISQKWIWELYIDTISKKWKVFVYAKNTPAEIHLVSDDGEEEYTTIYLAPWMYLEFRTGIWKNLNNADRLRISTVNKLGYLSGWDDENIDSTIQIYFTKEDNIYHDAMEHISQTDGEKNRYLDNIIWSEIPEISGYTYIQRYLHLFVNNEKKKVFYKNTLLSWYISLMKSKKVDDGLISQVKKDEQRLESIDLESYQELMSLRWDIISAIYAMQDSGYITSKLMFSQLVDPDLVESKWVYPLYSFSLFSGNNKQWESSEFITKSFFDSFTMYMENYSDTQNSYDYFLYFLEKRLIYLLSWNINEESIGSTLEVLTNYTSISNTAEYSEKNQKITQIYSITQVLESVDNFLRNTFFLTERDSNKLLVLQNNINLWGAKLTQLQSQIDSLYNIYENNKSLLSTVSSRDVKISKDIIQIEKNINEYLSAIWNYTQYKDIYDISKSTILNVDVLSNGQVWLSQEKWMEYLWQFIGFTQQWFTLNVVDETYYEVKDLVIGWRRFNFDIYPYSGSRIKNIYIDGELKTTQYTLDNIKEDWDEKYKTAPEEVRSQFDFSRFFILTFLTSKEREVIIFDKESKQQESTAEIVFKRDILLWDKWEFNSVKDFLKINYEDISLIQEWNSYNIFLNNVDLTLDWMKIEKRNEINGRLESQYVLNTTTHSFKDVKVFIENEKRWINNTIIYELWWESISMIWDIYILEMEEQMRAMLSHTEIYTNLYDILQQNTVENISIEFTPSNMKTRFKFDSGEKNFTIIIQNLEITGLYEWTSKVASWPIALQDINSYLK